MSDDIPTTDSNKGKRDSMNPLRLLHPVDSVIAALIFAVCGWLLYQTFQFEKVSFMLSQNVPPEMFPQLLIVIIGLLTAALPFEHILLRSKGKDIDKTRRYPIKGITWLSMGLLVAVAASSPLLGTFLTMVAVCVLLPILWGEKRLHYIIPFALLFPAAVTFVFNIVLGVFFEPGLVGIAFH